MTTPEGNLTKRIQAWLKAQPDIFSFKVHSTGMGINGIPDIVGNVGSRVFYVEVKAGKNRTSPIQAHRIAQIAKTGGAVIVAYCLEEVKELVYALRDEDPELAESRKTDRKF